MRIKHTITHGMKPTYERVNIKQTFYENKKTVKAFKWGLKQEVKNKQKVYDILT